MGGPVTFAFVVRPHLRLFSIMWVVLVLAETSLPELDLNYDQAPVSPERDQDKDKERPGMIERIVAISRVRIGVVLVVLFVGSFCVGIRAEWSF